ncbi:MAG: hypothetical protein EBS05_27675, partial [Proteobacteria bacterium]|nr:hypothetical protein [Pseudomonadota bacterium]
EIDGTLRFGAGSIAIHLIDREFARRLAAGGPGVALPFHRADKKIATCFSGINRPTNNAA